MVTYERKRKVFRAALTDMTVAGRQGSLKALVMLPMRKKVSVFQHAD
jgi:hypothetical protein